jgi:hypothetical protein
MNVRSFFAAFILVAFAAVSVSAQSIYKIGVTAGANYSSLRSDLFTTASGRMSGALGFSVLLGFGDFFELNPEILIVQKGADAKTVSFQPEEEIKESVYSYNYNSFEAALLAGFRPVRSAPIRIQAGAFLGSHFHSLDRSQRQLMVGNYEDINQAIRAVDLNDAFSGVDYGPVIGISAGEGRFRANARYYHGTRNLYNNLEFVEGGHHIRTNSLRLSLTYFFKQ